MLAHETYGNRSANRMRTRLSDSGFAYVTTIKDKSLLPLAFLYIGVPVHSGRKSLFRGTRPGHNSPIPPIGFGLIHCAQYDASRES